jgi:Bacterial PH domain
MRLSPADYSVPSSVNKYLLPQERQVIVVRRHPAVLAGPLVLAGGGLLAARKLASGSDRPELVWAASGLLLLDCLRRAAAWPVTYFVVTSERMLLIGGPLNRTVVSVPLDRSMGLTFKRTFLGRLIGYGSLTAVGPGQRPLFRTVRHLPYPEQLYLEVANLLSPNEPDGPDEEGGTGRGEGGPPW